MTENNRLKPCPFCGDENVQFHNGFFKDKNVYFVFVKCNICHARSGYTYSKDDPALTNYTNPASRRCLNDWNNRPLERSDYDNNSSGDNSVTKI